MGIFADLVNKLCCRPPQYAPVPWSVLKSQDLYPSGDLDLWPFDLELVCDVSRRMDNLRANFDASATFLCRVMVKHAWSWRRDVITLMLDLWGHRAGQWWGSSCCIHVPSSQFVGLLIPEIWFIISHGINRPIDLDLWPFDLLVGSRVWRCQSLVSCIPFCQFSSCNALPVSTYDQVLDRQTDRWTDRQRSSLHNAPTLWGRGIV